jgi:hypothetical protein
MESPALINVCISSFLSVFVLLAFLAGVMRVIMLLFPQKEIKSDGAVVAAIASTISTIYPGTKITNIKEMK